MKHFILFSMFIYFLSLSNNSNAQGYFNKVNICDSCLSGFYSNALINHNNELIVQGAEGNNSSFALTINKYISGTSTYIPKKIIDTNQFSDNIFFQNKNNNYILICNSLLLDSNSTTKGVLTSYMYKLDTLFNLYEKKILYSNRNDSVDYYRKSLFINNKIYCFGDYVDSLNSYLKYSIGFTILDTNGNKLFKKVYHLFPNKETYFTDVTFDGSFIYITGQTITNIDECTNYFDGFVTKLDTLGNLIWNKSFPKLYQSGFASVSITAQNNIFLTGLTLPSCFIFDEIPHINNVVIDANNNILDSFDYSIPNIHVQGADVQIRNDSTMMVLAYQNPQKGYWKNFAFQTTKNNGQIITESIHELPDSCLKEHPYNKHVTFIRNPITKGYIMAGQAVRLMPNKINYYVQPWILSVDSNGCIDGNNCAVPLNNQEIIKEKQKITIYPNPSYNGIYHINSTEKITWKILNIEGNMIAQGIQNNIDISKEAIGIYILQINTKNNLQTIKLQKL